MRTLDWIVVGVYLVWIVYDGLKRTKDTDEVEGYFLANRSLPWWAVGLSVMATQLSAITLVGTTGQGYADGMRFVQFYFGLPIAMVILSVTLVPFFYRARVFTAYEYLEQRFDVKTRTLASVLFLMSRGLSCGVIIAAPAVILSIMLGWNLTLTILAIGAADGALHDVGGVQAVTWTDVKQMVVIVAGVARRGRRADRRPAGRHRRSAQALHVAGAAGRLNAIDFTLRLCARPTRSGRACIGGLFLMLSYFGCDQSQVQRYLTAKSVDEGRHSLLMSAFVKIPLQALVLLTGVLVFVFYLFNQPPMLFNRCDVEKIQKSARAGGARGARDASSRRRSRRAATASTALAEAATTTAPATRDVPRGRCEARGVRGRAAALAREVGDDGYKDFTGDTPTPTSTTCSRRSSRPSCRSGSSG